MSIGNQGSSTKNVKLQALSDFDAEMKWKKTSKIRVLHWTRKFFPAIVFYVAFFIFDFIQFLPFERCVGKNLIVLDTYENGNIEQVQFWF